ncbi:MAG: stage V sporulation protein AD [Eubacterium sp.]|nr:stage V sporulation protein AD [Eubacterium sp.]MDE6155919.1 stage V sporulation protein AD [Eubacterium sp.]MDE6471387.1 stage V sporulation protein AD [Eubacterium sp.]MDE6766817.1 stage V sporulation protein AD [Eubacterium sp.]
MHIKGKTIFFDTPPVIAGHAGVAGKKEGEGPLAQDFDAIFEDTTMGQQSYELAESAMLHDAIIRALSDANVSPSEVDFVLSGDLLDQCMGSSFALKDLEIPSIGLYGACSTMALSLSVGSMLIDGGASCVVAGTSSHFCSSERQFRFPLEYGGQRPPSAQWTVTGAGSAVLAQKGSGVKIKAIQIGTITDLGIKDANNMGAAMAPAASRTISDFLKDTNTQPQDYDMILTGDLGYTGSELLYELMQQDYKIKLNGYHKDCGMLIYDLKEQDVNSGGSGCGCSASVLCSHILKNMEQGKLKKVLFVATGALMSPTSNKQGNTIPGIAHAVLLER